MKIGDHSPKISLLKTDKFKDKSDYRKRKKGYESYSVKLTLFNV